MTRWSNEEPGSLLEQELLSLKALLGDEGVSPDLVRFQEALARAQAKARAEVRAAMAAAAEDARDASTRPSSLNGSAQLPRGERRLRQEEVSLDSSILTRLAAALVEAVPEGSEQVGISALGKAVEDDDELLGKIARAAMPGGDARDLAAAASKLDLPAEALLLVGRLLASPFAWEARLARGEVLEIDARNEEPRQACRCPSCGSLPMLAVLGQEDGARRLHCSLCGDAWLAPRLACPACGNQDHEKLGTLCVDESDPRWAEVCDACRRYIKTVDEKRLGGVDALLPRVEDVRSMYLDMIAEEEGYARTSL
ncbi:MAG: formate dehydrogenase accessory protein FdhE [Myxococcota bacterium]